MIIVNLKGGLGNQMFQYALGRALAIKNNTTLKLRIDDLANAEALGNIYRPFDLDNFSIEKTIANQNEVESIHTPLKKVCDLFTRKILRNNHVCFEPAILKLKGDQYLDGYWQSPNYFNDIRDTLLKDFTLKKELSLSGQALANKIKSTDSISLHIRRGDYINNPRVFKEYGICSANYYQQALEIITAKVTSPTLFIFSDDINWVKANLNLPATTTFVTDKTLSDPDELYLMSLCQHNIIANSSFSWWAAWLNPNPNKIVVAPEPWFDKVKYDEYLIPASWQLLPKT